MTYIIEGPTGQKIEMDDFDEDVFENLEDLPRAPASELMGGWGAGQDGDPGSVTIFFGRLKHPSFCIPPF